jgi:hypothetical protein
MHKTEFHLWCRALPPYIHDNRISGSNLRGTTYPGVTIEQNEVNQEAPSAPSSYTTVFGNSRYYVSYSLTPD